MGRVTLDADHKFFYLKVADPVFNREQTWKMMQEAADQDVKILVFPELGLTGYTCGDLFLQDTLVDQARKNSYGS